MRIIKKRYYILRKYVYLFVFVTIITQMSLANGSTDIDKYQEANVMEIRGLVSEESTVNPLYEAVIAVKGKSIATMSDEEGRFVLYSDNLTRDDTLTVSYIGYETAKVSLKDAAEGEILCIRLRRTPIRLNELSVIYRKINEVTKGRRRSWGLIKCYIDGSTAGDCYGYEVHTSPKRRMFLDKVGFYYCDGDSAMTAMKFRINIYDMSNVKGDVTDKFVSVLDSPIYFEFERGAEKSGKFEYLLTDAVELPKDAMVEIEMLENLNESKLWFKSNVVGKKNWSRSLGDAEWMLTPFSVPFFIDCAELKEESGPVSSREFHSISSGAELIR